MKKKLLVGALISSILGQLNSVLGFIFNILLIKYVTDKEQLSAYIFISSYLAIYMATSNYFFGNGRELNNAKNELVEKVYPFYIFPMVAIYILKFNILDFYAATILFLMIVMGLATIKVNYRCVLLINEAKWNSANIIYLMPYVVNLIAIYAFRNYIGIMAAIIANLMLSIFICNRIRIENTNKKIVRIKWSESINSIEPSIIYLIELITVVLCYSSDVTSYALGIRIVFALSTIFSYGIISISSQVNKNVVNNKIFQLALISVMVNLFIVKIILIVLEYANILGKVKDLESITSIILMASYGGILGARSIYLKFNENKTSIIVYLILMMSLIIVERLIRIEYMGIFLPAIAYHLYSIYINRNLKRVQ